MSDRPLVIVPQLAGSRALVRPFTDALPRELAVEVIEPPGFGTSASPRGLPSTRRLAEAALDTWDRRGLGRAHLFGISIGGMVAQWMAIDAPGLVARLVLASTAAHGLRLVRQGGLRPWRMARCLLAPEVGPCWAEQVLEDGPLTDVNELLEPVREQARSTRDLLWLAAAAARHDARDALSALRAPTLVLTGRDDRIIRPDTQADLATSIPDARHELVPDAAHDLTLEQPAACAARVAEFLRAPRTAA
jgi:pimeloyl-ACP methyl ester carboxylesterase